MERTVQSVVNQACSDLIEHIVIDGGSNDNSRNIIDTYRQHFAYWCSEKDRGIYPAMNKGIARASGDYVLFLNSGDLLADKDVLSRLAALPLEADVVSGHTILMGESRELWKSPCSVSLLFFMKGSLSHQSTLIKRSLLLKYPYDEAKKIISDWKFTIETLVVHNCSYQAVDVVVSHYDKTGISSNPAFFAQADREKNSALAEMVPPRILCDYRKLVEGDTPFMKLMVRISHNKKYAQLVYALLYPVTKLYCRIFRKQLLHGL